MVFITLKVGPKGQIVIPKKIRESLGIIENKTIELEVKDKKIEFKATPSRDLVAKWREHARKSNADVSKWVMGDQLYEEVFS